MFDFSAIKPHPLANRLSLDLEEYNDGKRILWELSLDGVDIGEGRLNLMREYSFDTEWCITGSAITKRGIGLYSGYVLPMLANILGTIHSDPTRSDAAEGAWRKVRGAQKCRVGGRGIDARGGYVWRVINLNPTLDYGSSYV